MAPKRFVSVGECMIEFSRETPSSWRMGYAGDTLNCAWYFHAAAASHGWQTAFLTRLGSDPFSDQITAYLQENGIGVEWVRRESERQPGLYLIDTDDGERSFTYWRNHSAARLLADDEEYLREALLAVDAIFFSGITLAILAPDRRETLLGALQDARRAGKTVIFDPNIREKLWEERSAITAAIMLAAAVSSTVLPSLEDEQRLFGDPSLEACAKRYADAGVDEVVIKNGGEDICVALHGAVQRIPLSKAVEVLDTTGAGDSFNGAYLAARLNGVEIVEAVHRAHAVASRVIGCHGALMPMDKISGLNSHAE